MQPHEAKKARCGTFGQQKCVQQKPERRRICAWFWGEGVFWMAGERQDSVRRCRGDHGEDREVQRRPWGRQRGDRGCMRREGVGRRGDRGRVALSRWVHVVCTGWVGRGAGALSARCSRTDDARDGEREDGRHRPVDVEQQLRLGGEGAHGEEGRGPQVGEEDAAPVGAHLDRVDGVLDVELVEAEDDEPDADPDVAAHDEGGVGQHVQDRSARERADGERRAQVWQLAVEKKPVGHANHDGRRRAKDDECLDVGVLQRLDVGKDGGEEGDGDKHKAAQFGPLEFVNLDEAEQTTHLDRHPRAGHLHARGAEWRPTEPRALETRQAAWRGAKHASYNACAATRVLRRVCCDACAAT
eukprot:823375-Pleurochrysis_carterae.AAC.2